MSLRFLLPMLLPACLAAAGDQTAKVADQPAKSPSHHRIRLGGVMVSGGYGYYSGFPYYGYYPGLWGLPYYYYDPFLWSPFYYPGYFTGYAYQPGMGNVKIQAGEKDATVFLDGALAGPVQQLKSIWLEPGVYNLELREGKERLTQKIYVLSGKTLKVTPAMMNREAMP